MKHVLIPTDFSAASAHACHYALRLAQVLPLNLHLLHVVSGPAHSPHPMGNEHEQDPTYEHAQEKMGQLITELRHKAQQLGLTIPISQGLRSGEVAAEVLHEIAQRGASLLILGIKPRSLAYRIFVGSHANHILEQAPVPVLAVPSGANFHGIRRCLYASAFDPADGPAIDDLFHLFRALQPQIEVVHIADEGTDSLSEAEQHRLTEQLKTHLSAPHRLYPLETTILDSGNMFRALDAYTEQANIDLLAMTTHRRSLFKRLFDPSLTEEVLFHTRVPLLVFRAGSRHD
ncbi:MAG: universal stress protein [Bacteroidetes bacterium]|nr:MAG: universal stress protein [Bacteroidota bacterium]